MQTEIRKLPPKTIFIISSIILIAFIIFFSLKSLKEQKFTEILATVGHTNIKDIKVISKLDVEDSITKYKSNVYKIMFYDNDLKQTCIGFIHREKDAHYTKDLDCK